MNNEETAFNFAELDEDEQFAYAVYKKAYDKWFNEFSQEDFKQTIQVVSHFYDIQQHAPLTHMIAMFFYGYIEGLHDGSSKFGTKRKAQP